MPRWFSVLWVPKLLHHPVNNRIFGPKTAQFGPFGVMSDKKNNADEMRTWFSDMWLQEILLPPKIIRMFGPKSANFAPKYAFGAHIGLAGSLGTLLVC